MRFFSVILFLTGLLSMRSADLNNVVWQLGSKLIASGYSQRYEFEDSIFRYYKSEYLGLSNTFAVTGFYSVSGDSIRLTPRYLLSHKTVGFNCDFMTNSQGGWENVSGYNDNPRVDTVPLDMQTVVLPFKFTTDSIIIDDKVFFYVAPCCP